MLNYCKITTIDPVQQLDKIRYFIESRYEKAEVEKDHFIRRAIEDVYGFTIGDSVKMFFFSVPNRIGYQITNYCIFVGNDEDIKEMLEHDQCTDVFKMNGYYCDINNDQYRVVGIIPISKIHDIDFIIELEYPEDIVGCKVSCWDYYFANSRYFYYFMNYYGSRNISKACNVLYHYLLLYPDKSPSVTDYDKIADVAQILFECLIHNKWAKAVHTILANMNDPKGAFGICTSHGIIYDPNDNDDDDELLI